MGYAVYEIGEGKWGGYGVPAVCEHPGCNNSIDRGMSHACGGRPFHEKCCDRYFCSKHLFYHAFNMGGRREYASICARCKSYRSPFPYKPETKEWIEHLLKDKTWEKWRLENSLKVKKMTQDLIDKKYSEPVEYD